MPISININTTEGLSDLDVKVLGAIAGAAGAVWSGATVETPSVQAKAAELASRVGADKPAPAKKAAAVKPKIEEPKDTEEDVAGVDSEYTLQDAIDKATQMISEGNAKGIKAALVAIGAEKVSKLTDEQVGQWFAALAEDD